MIQADNQGVVNGKFTVPARVPAGTKSVVFVGGTGSRAQTTYTGSGTITTRQLRQVTDITVRFDPLAQTFTLPESRLLAGVDLWFTKKGINDVRVQVRETATGLPTQVVLGEAIKKSSEVFVDGKPTEFRFDPVFAGGGVEYAIVVLTDDPDYKVRIAELGKYDKERGWVCQQPYQVGVLLSSSNAATWTPHQEKDLTFRLLAARFTKTRQEVSCGTITADNTSDLMSLASVDRPGSETDVRFVVTMPATQTEPARTFEVLDNQVLNLDKRVSGELQVTAHLSGSEKLSPVLLPNPQMAKGNLLETADYISRAIPCGQDSNLKISLDVQFSGQSGIDVYRETTTDNWQQLTEYTTESAGDGWMERTYKETGLDQDMIRVKLVLKGNTRDRPRARNLRVITT